MHSYLGKNILITGGSKGIGFAIARTFAGLGSNLFLVARTKLDLEKAKRRILEENPSVQCEIFPADVSRHDQVHKAVRVMLSKMGGIDGLVNNAGRAYPEYFEKMPIDTFEDLIRVDYLGSVYFAKEVYPHLKPGSFIAFVSSVAGYIGTFGFTSYSPAKFAVIGLAESLWQEARSRRIQISVLCPPDTETPGLEKEALTKPVETRKLSETASLMKAEDVAARFVKKLAKGQFLINVNFESELFYRLHAWFPGLSRWVMMRIIGQ